MEVAEMEAKVREFGRRHPEFIREDAMNKTAAATFKCKFCDRAFEKERSVGVHESQCRKNPDAHQWPRGGKVKRRVGAQPGNHNAVKRSYAQRKGLTDNRPINYKSIDQMAKDKAAPPAHLLPKTETMAGVVETTVLHAVNLAATAPAPPPVPARATFSVSRLYDYLLALILLAILLCGIIYAALGVKLLLGL